MSINNSDIERFQSAVVKSIRDHWVLFLVEGIVLVILGLLAIAIPPIASLAVAFLVGWLILISGIVGFAMTFMMRHAPGFWWSLASAVLATASGVLLLGWPEGGVLSLTLVLIVFFMLEGIASIMFAIDHRNQLSGRWGWMLASGIVDLVLASLIFVGLPGTAAWAIGLLVGINMIFGGTSLIAMALHARAIDPAVSAPASRPTM
jgi:uncharacterized membrane protein HdeD (DUF308 family)